MFGISGTELGIILIFALIIFGPDKLPQLGRTIGRFMNEFKRAQESVEQTIKAEMFKDEDGASHTEADSTQLAATPEAHADDEEEEDEE